MPRIKIRAGLLGLLALLALSAFSAAPAFAEGGPFCHHRNNSKEGEGARITEAEPEEIAGHGGEQVLTGKAVLMTLNVVAKQAQIKGILYNNADQCQAKVSITYEGLSVLGQETKCNVQVNSNNVVKLYGHQAWKWNGEKKQLEEKSQALQHRDWIFTPVELQQGATGLPTGTFAALTFTNKTGQTCPFNGVTQLVVEGSATVYGYAAQRGVENQNLGEWDEAEELVSTGGEGSQHFWNGTQFIGVQTGLKFGEAAKYKGKLEVNTIGKQGKTPPQEVAYFES